MLMIVLIAGSEYKLQTLVNKVGRDGGQQGFKVNGRKPKTMVISRKNKNNGDFEERYANYKHTNKQQTN